VIAIVKRWADNGDNEPEYIENAVAVWNSRGFMHVAVEGRENDHLFDADVWSVMAVPS
jgi:hypothetical protein